uniref:BHLH domain-containing protein n=1 Tax=Steinernema glaseri TaxID=37863 RepID=A0A1I7YL55_9BILA
MLLKRMKRKCVAQMKADEQECFQRAVAMLDNYVKQLQHLHEVQWSQAPPMGSQIVLSHDLIREPVESV